MIEQMIGTVSPWGQKGMAVDERYVCTYVVESVCLMNVVESVCLMNVIVSVCLMYGVVSVC